MHPLKALMQYKNATIATMSRVHITTRLLAGIINVLSSYIPIKFWFCIITSWSQKHAILQWFLWSWWKRNNLLWKATWPCNTNEEKCLNDSDSNHWLWVESSHSTKNGTRVELPKTVTRVTLSLVMPICSVDRVRIIQCSMQRGIGTSGTYTI